MPAAQPNGYVHKTAVKQISDAARFARSDLLQLRRWAVGVADDPPVTAGEWAAFYVNLSRRLNALQGHIDEIDRANETAREIVERSQ